MHGYSQSGSKTDGPTWTPELVTQMQPFTKVFGFIQLQKEAGYCTPDCISALSTWMDNGGHFA